MRLPRLPSGLVLPAVLVGLVLLLGGLQYQWLGKVSEAEREQLRRSLEQRGREFADEFDGEITRLHAALQLSRAAVEHADWHGFADSVERWRRTARFPRLPRAIYLVQGSGDGRTLRAWEGEGGRFGDPLGAWPPHLDRVRVQLAGVEFPPVPRVDGKNRVVAITVTPFVSDLPALLIPVSNTLAAPAASRGAQSGGGEALLPPPSFRLPWPGAYLLVDLDADYLRQEMLPALAARHFPAVPAGYGVAVLSSASTPIFVRGFDSRAPVDPDRADVVVPFFALRPETVRDLLAPRETITYRARIGSTPEPKDGGRGPQQVAVMVERRTDMAAGPAAAAGQVRVLRPGWRLVLRHPAGSLDAAVSQARQRNLWLGFGILAVLAAGVVLVMANARRASQLAARQMDFVATVSHELRTPLTVIRAAAQNLSSGVIADPAQARRYGELIEGEGRRLTDMVEQVLEYAGLRGGVPLRVQPVDVRQVLQAVEAECRPLCQQAGVALELTVPAQLSPLVAADAAALRRAVLNLVANALKHAAEGRWVGVTLTIETVHRRQEVHVAVSDRGPGVESADLPHIFEPFYRGRRAHDGQVAGNGLGLSLVKRVAEAHGGAVSVKPTPGGGATFVLSLPAVSATQAADASAAGAARPAGLPA